MNTFSSFGTEQHQALLNHIAGYYHNDIRVHSLIVFGSIGRGNWDAYSDLDLDVIIADDAIININTELRALCDSFAGLNERAALIIPDNDDAGDIVLESLMQLSIRYHSLAQTSPNIVESMQVIGGSLDRAAIVAAGDANRSKTLTPLSHLLDRCVRDVAVANVGYQRQQIWATVEILQRMRSLLMEIFARTHGGVRGYQTFERLAEPRIQTRLGAALPQYDLNALLESFKMIINVLEDDLGYLSNGQLSLTDAHKIIVSRVRQAIDD